MPKKRAQKAKKSEDVASKEPPKEAEKEAEDVEKASTKQRGQKRPFSPGPEKEKEKEKQKDKPKQGEGTSSSSSAYPVGHPSHPQWKAPSKEPRKFYEREEEEEEEEEEADERAPTPTDQDLIGLDEDDEDEEEGTQASTSSGKSKRKRQDPVILTSAQEKKIAEWLRDSPMFYNKGLNSYKCHKNKKELWDKFAQEMGLTSEQMRRWYNTMRTAYGKLTKTKSGQAARKFTEREQWILDSFDFLKDHISRCPSRQVRSVSK